MSANRSLRAALTGAALVAIISPAAAQEWPTRAITAISPFSAGNANDIVGRVVLDPVSKQLGQPIVVENRPGGGGSMAPRCRRQGRPRWLHNSAAFIFVQRRGRAAQDAALRSSRRFHGRDPFGAQPSVLVSGAVEGFKTVADIVAAAKAKPGSLNFASAGSRLRLPHGGGTLPRQRGLSPQHIPFRGPAEAFAEVMAGRIDFYFLPIAPALPMVADGKLMALAVSTPERAPALPNVPTTAEAGFPGASYLFWGGLFVPKKTPNSIVVRLHDEAKKALDLPSVQERLSKVGVQPLPMTSEQFDKFFRDDVAVTVKLAKEVGIKPLD